MSIKTLLYGLGLGAGAMYLLDPERGNRRRALMRDQAIRTLNRMDDGINKGTRDLSNRASGVIAEARTTLTGEEVSDNVLAQRVRSKIGRTVSHPRAIHVTAEDGRITLRGPILASDVTALLGRVATVRGVRGIDNQLEVHDEPGSVPALQGEPAQSSRERAGEGWTPGIRLVAALAGGMMTVTGWRQGGIMGNARRFVGLGLLARSVTNRGLGHLIGISGEAGAVTVHKGIKVNAPVEEVFSFWQNYDNFARFMSNVLEVRDIGEGKSHWKVNGPAGTPVEWDAIVTNLVPNQLLAWESVPGSTVMQTGQVRFAPAEEGGTHVNVLMSYTPPAGVIGHAVASFFGVNPKQAMDEDLLRFKSLIERGKISAKGETIEREDVQAKGGNGSVSAGKPEGQASRQAKQQSDQAGRQGKETTRQSHEQPAPGTGRASFAGPADAGQAPATPHGSATDLGERRGPAAHRPGSFSGPETGHEDSGLPGGGAGRVDEVGSTGVFPVSGPLPDDNAPVQGMASWGQGERGAAGYEDHGDSELSGLGEETDFGSVIPGQPEEPERGEGWDAEYDAGSTVE